MKLGGDVVLGGDLLKSSPPDPKINYELQEYVDDILQTFIDEYQTSNQPIQVSFRDLVSWVPYTESLTHYIHSYPAKLLKHIPIFFLNSKILNEAKGGKVLDPFCGSGTVLLEAIKNGYDGIGCDSNPLARLIAKVKTTPIEPIRLNKYVNTIVKRSKQFRSYSLNNVVNIDHWFPIKTQVALSKIYRAINEVVDEDEKDFLLVVFSNIVKKTSFADPNINVPVKLKPEKYSNPDIKSKVEKRYKKIESLDVFIQFESQLKSNIERMKLLASCEIDTVATVISDDARVITESLDDPKSKISDESVDFILTSPPYSGAQKYIRSSSLNLGWLEFCETKTLRDYERKNIGREHYSKSEYSKLIEFGEIEIDSVLRKVWEVNPLRAHINGNYLLEMKHCLVEMYRVLKSGRYCVIVIGNNEVCGLEFETHKYLEIMAREIGFKQELVLIDDIHSRGLMTKRNKTASIINSEWILVFKK